MFCIQFKFLEQRLAHKDETKILNMLLTIILLVAGIIAFAIFFKSIDFFDKI